ncbi:MAG: ATP-binding cassette domain-containing protein [Myxococcales bacterium]|nr:ATP-binding cassette domain-containing protein [Myxococcales bacterium]
MSWDLDARARFGPLDLHIRLATDAPVLLVVGPNGAGKTSLLRLIAGVRPLAAGHLRLAGRDLAPLPPEGRGIGYVPQNSGLFPHLTALGNVAFGLHALPRAARAARARALLAEVDAEHLADRLPRALSGGEQQRVALARALGPAPGALLLDEPLAALDVSARRALRQHLADRLARAGRPAVIVTHDLRDLLALPGEVVVLEAGRVTQHGLAATLAAAPASDFVEELFSPLRGGQRT